MSVEDTLKLALDALEDSQLSKTNAAIKALEEALANHCEDNLDMVKQEQGEPVAWMFQRDAIAEMIKEQQRMAKRIDELEAELAHQEQGEPVAWMNPYGGVLQRLDTGLEKSTYTIPLYTTPQQRKPLTHKQRLDLLIKFKKYEPKWDAPSILIDMVEDAHDIKE
jgi:hypothetical protein